MGLIGVFIHFYALRMPAKCEKCREEVRDGRREKVKRPIFAFPGEPARRCKEHMGDGMEDVVNKRCEQCGKIPTLERRIDYPELSQFLELHVCLLARAGSRGRLDWSFRHRRCRRGAS